jgi:hypothetical protein
VLGLALTFAGVVPVAGASDSVTGDLGVMTVQLGWSAFSDGSGSGVSAYRLHRDGGAGGATDVVVSGTSYIDRNTTSGASYDYTVHALDAVGNESGASNVVSLTLGGKSGGPKGGGGGGGNGKGKNK